MRAPRSSAGSSTRTPSAPTAAPTTATHARTMFSAAGTHANGSRSTTSSGRSSRSTPRSTRNCCAARSVPGPRTPSVLNPAPRRVSSRCNPVTSAPLSPSSRSRHSGSSLASAITGRPSTCAKTSPLRTGAPVEHVDVVTVPVRDVTTARGAPVSSASCTCRSSASVRSVTRTVLAGAAVRSAAGTSAGTTTTMAAAVAAATTIAPSARSAADGKRISAARGRGGPADTGRLRDPTARRRSSRRRSDHASHVRCTCRRRVSQHGGTRQ